MKYSLVILLACLMGCKAQKKKDTAPMDNMEETVLLIQDYHNGFQEYDVTVIENTKSLNALFSQINKTRKPGLPVPIVDFNKDQVILICLGEQSGTKKAVLTKNQESTDSISVTVNLIDKETENQEVNAVSSYPFYVYKMPRISKKLDFKKGDW